MDLTYLANLATIFSAVIAILGIPYGLWQLRLSRAATSADLVVNLNDSLRDSWRDYTLAETGELKRYHLNDVFTTIELIATLRSDGMFIRRSGHYAQQLLDSHIQLLLEDPDTTDSLDAALRDEASELSKLINERRKNQLDLGQSVDTSPPTQRIADKAR